MTLTSARKLAVAAIAIATTLTLQGCSSENHSEAFITICDQVALANESLLANANLVSPEAVISDRAIVQNEAVDAQSGASTGTGSYFSILNISNLFYDTEALAKGFTEEEQAVFPEASTLEAKSTAAQAALYRYLNAPEDNALNAQTEWFLASQDLTLAVSNSGFNCSLK